MKIARREEGFDEVEEVVFEGRYLNAGSTVDGRGGISSVKFPMLAPPWDQPRLPSVAVISGKPMRDSVGRRTCLMYSKDGEPETLVPPLSRRWIGSWLGKGEKRMNGSMAWRASPVLPAVPMSRRHS